MYHACISLLYGMAGTSLTQVRYDVITVDMLYNESTNHMCKLRFITWVWIVPIIRVCPANYSNKLSNLVENF